MESPVALLLLLLLCLGALAPTPGSASSEAPPLVNEDVKRTVDLSSHLAKVTAEVVLVHPGGGSTSRASSFVLALEPELESRLAHLGVQWEIFHGQAPSCS
ncbi:ribophorin I, isoform CRA_b [Mus musculus]|nr:ribophorin I, isoform CRA_b [Mus musculus]